MPYKAIILDLDNTIYPVHSIGDKLFETLFKLISNSREDKGRMEEIKNEIMRKPFQVVAKQFGLSEGLIIKGIELLKDLSYEALMNPFDGYEKMREIRIDKYLVTTGFRKLQQSKVERLGIENDFIEIHIVDPMTSSQTKKDVFATIIKNHHYLKGEVVVVGDDPDSEISAANSLQLDAVLFDELNLHPEVTTNQRVTNYNELLSVLGRRD